MIPAPCKVELAPAREERPGFLLKTHIGYDAISEVRAEWERLQHHPNSDFDHYNLVCRRRKDLVHPWALSIWEEDNCRAILAGRLEQKRLRPSIGYARLPAISAKVLTVLHEGILGDLDDPASRAVAEALFQMIHQRDVDMVSFHALPERFAGLWTAFRCRPGQTLGAVSPEWTTHRQLALPSEPGFLLKGMRSKHRSWVKRKERELSEAFPNAVQWSWHREIADLADLCRRMEEVARTTYQRGLGAGFVNNEETRQRLALFISRQQTRACLLEISGIPKGFWLGTAYRGVFYSAATGYTPDMRPFEVGTSMFLRLVDELVREGFGRLDFGLGDADYKERFGSASSREADVQLFGRASKSRCLRAYLLCANLCGRAARRAVQRLGVLARLKKAWRARVGART